MAEIDTPSRILQNIPASITQNQLYNFEVPFNLQHRTLSSSPSSSPSPTKKFKKSNFRFEERIGTPVATYSNSLPLKKKKEMESRDSQILRKITSLSTNLKTCYRNFVRSILDELVDRDIAIKRVDREIAIKRANSSDTELDNQKKISLTIIIDKLRELYDEYIDNIDIIEEEKKQQDNNKYLDFLINTAAPTENFKKMVNIRNFYMVLLMGDVDNIEGYANYANFLQKYTKNNNKYDSDYDENYFKKLYADTFRYIKEHYQTDVEKSNYFQNLYDPEFKHPTLNGGRHNKSNCLNMNMKYIKELCKINQIKLSTTKNDKRVIYKKKELITKLKKKKII